MQTATTRNLDGLYEYPTKWNLKQKKFLEIERNTL